MWPSLQHLSSSQLLLVSSIIRPKKYPCFRIAVRPYSKQYVPTVFKSFQNLHLFSTYNLPKNASKSFIRLTSITLSTHFLPLLKYLHHNPPRKTCTFLLSWHFLLSVSSPANNINPDVVIPSFIPSTAHRPYIRTSQSQTQSPSLHNWETDFSLPPGYIDALFAVCRTESADLDWAGPGDVRSDMFFCWLWLICGRQHLFTSRMPSWRSTFLLYLSASTAWYWHTQSLDCGAWGGD